MTLITTESLSVEFADLLSNVCNILNSCSNKEKNLEECKHFCSFLPISEISSEFLFSRRKIKDCSDFNELLQLLKCHMNWEEHSILTKMAEKCKSVKAQNEIKKFEKKLALYEGLEIICSSVKFDSSEFMKFYAVIDKSYKKITLKEYRETKAYILKTLKAYPYVIKGFTKLLYSSLHIEWLIIVQAVPYLIEMAHQKKDVFINEKFVFMRIGSETIFNKVL